MYISGCVCVRACVCMYLGRFVWVESMHGYIKNEEYVEYTYMCRIISVCVCVCMCVCVCVYVCSVYVRSQSAFADIQGYIYIYIYVYIYTHTCACVYMHLEHVCGYAGLFCGYTGLFFWHDVFLRIYRALLRIYIYRALWVSICYLLNRGHHLSLLRMYRSLFLT